jgi:hypothetical protein
MDACLQAHEIENAAGLIGMLCGALVVEARRELGAWMPKPGGLRFQACELEASR